VNASVDVRGRASFAALTGVGALALSLGAMLLTRLTSAPEAAPGLGLVARALLEAFLTALASPIVLAGMRRLDGLFHREEPGLLR
jgi:rod shape-determining protein MreD